MKKSLLLLAFIGAACLVNACGGSGGSTQIGVVTHFSVTAPAAVSIGEFFNLTVTALDSQNNLVTSYSGFVQFSSTDPNFPLPGDEALASGMGTFSMSLETAGSQTITLTDQTNSRVSGTSNPISVKLGVVRLEVDATSFASTGTSFNFTITAIDGLNHTFPDYSGTVSFTSTDGQAVLPADSPLTSGTATFSLKFNTTGPQTVTATDTATASLTGTSTSIWVSAPASGFTPTGSMFTPRSGHTATLLNDGNVLVVGGMEWGCPPMECNLHALASAETYDTPQGYFQRTGFMSVPRVFHTATLLGDGKVLVTGGDDRYSTKYDTAEIFDPSTGVFTPTGNMVSARSGHSATLLTDGKVLLVRGLDGSGNWTTTAEIFDPPSGTFTPTGSMSVGGPGQTATLLNDGRVLVAGGGTGTPLAPTATAEIFDPSTGLFTPTGNMNVARTGHTATLLNDGRVLVAGGGTGTPSAPTATAEIFDPSTGLFTPTGNLVTARGGQTETLLTDGKVLLTGGSSGKSVYLSSAEWFDPSTGTFAIAGNMEIQRAFHRATLLKNGEVLITGGNIQDGSVPVRTLTLATAELFP